MKNKTITLNMSKFVKIYDFYYTFDTYVSNIIVDPGNGLAVPVMPAPGDRVSTPTICPKRFWKWLVAIRMQSFSGNNAVSFTGRPYIIPSQEIPTNKTNLANSTSIAIQRLCFRPDISPLVR